MLQSLKSKLLLTVTSVVMITTVSIMFFVQMETEKVIFKSQDESAKNLLNSVRLSVENEYRSLLFHKAASLEKRKAELKSVITVAIHMLEHLYKRFENGELSEKQAKDQAIAEFKKVRYDRGVGYIWINDMGRPIPKMIMHPTIPELDGKILDDPKFNCALGNHTNLFKAFVDTCSTHGHGFVDYFWPKPTRDGLTTEQPKLSYTRLFHEWGWILGTGLYIDDINQDIQNRLNAILVELKKSFSEVNVAQSGYMFLFNGKKQMLIHPSLQGADFSKLINPVTGNPILDDLIAASKTKEGRLDYIWEKPPEHKKDFRFWKRSYVAYFEPLDWYIASSVYYDEQKLPAKKLRSKILYLSTIFIAIALTVSILLADNLAKPLQRLTRAAKSIRSRGLSRAEIPITGTVETRMLGTIFDQMITSIQVAVKEKEELVLALESSNKEMAHTNERLYSEVRERKRAEKALNEAKNRAEEASRTKSEFLANMSHEIRTPLNAVTGFSELLSSLVVDQKQKKYLNAIKTAGKSLLTLINDILDLSKIEAGQLELQYQPVDLRNMFSEIEQIFRLKVSRKKLAFIIEVDDDVPQTVKLDEARLRQVILNLVGNAVKFTENGYVRMGVKAFWKGHAQHFIDLVISVEDSGIGIAENDIGPIFDPFRQQKGQQEELYEGTGLGLAISRKLARMMNGDIKADSKKGKGSIFKILLKDVAISAASVEIEKTSEALISEIDFVPSKVLVADDIESNRELLKEVLIKCNFDVIMATDGKKAVEMADQYLPDIIIMDIRMPVMDGFEAAMQLMENRKTASIPVIALTASLESGILEKIRNNNFEGCLSKPVNISDLLDTLKNHISHEKNKGEPHTGNEALGNGILAEKIIDLRMLVTVLKNQLVQVADDLAHVMNMEKIEAFSNRIRALGQHHNAGTLLIYSDRLDKMIVDFDVENIEKSLLDFTNLVNAFEQCKGENNEQ